MSRYRVDEAFLSFVAEPPLCYADTGSAHHSTTEPPRHHFLPYLFPVLHFPHCGTSSELTNIIQSRLFQYRSQLPTVVRLLISTSNTESFFFFVTKMFINLVMLLLVMFTRSPGPVSGQILRLGHCPSFSVLKDFEMDKVHY
jgi:hypothetical protein